MLKKVQTLAQKLSPGGLTPKEIDRLIAKVEDDGTTTIDERRSLEQLLKNDGFVRAPKGRKKGGPDNFVGKAESRLVTYVEFLKRLEKDDPLRRPLAAKVDDARYKANVEILAGEKPATIREGRKSREVAFKDRFVPSKQNQLDDVLKWLGQHYSDLGLEWELQPVKWRKDTYWNLVVTIPGASDEQILMADHYDTADKEEGVDANLVQLERDHKLSKAEIKKRKGSIHMGHAVPGADDNASATAALMEMGAFLSAEKKKGVRFGKTIKLVHLVGEEMPADCLGGRAYVRDAKKRGDRIGGVIVLDMIGVDRKDKKKFQISVGRDPRSLEIAERVKRAVQEHDLDLKPVFRPYGSRKSFLTQTDGVTFSRGGFPVVLLNEHLNNDRDLFRVGYHDEFDIPALIDFDYASDIVRAAMSAAYSMAEPRFKTRRSAARAKRAK